MKFTKNNVRLINIRQFNSKKGTLLTFLKIGDTETCESVDFLADRDFDPMDYHEGSNYDLVMDFDWKYVRVELLPIKKV